MAGKANWKTLSIQIPGENLLEGAQHAMEGVVVYLEVVKTILETVKVFAVDIGNPVKPIVEALLQMILTMFETLRRSGIYAWWDIPDPLTDPNFNRFVGGYPAFTARFKAGLIDPRDPNRPQPIAGATRSGFMIIVADAESALGLYKYLQVLMRFFGREFAKPQFPAPGNVKVLPLGAKGDPILALDHALESQPSSMVVEWSLPPMSPPGDPGFADLIEGLSEEFIPPKFLIERSDTNPMVGELTPDQLGDANTAGPVSVTVETDFRERGSGNIVNRKVRLLDEYGQQFLKFQKYISIDLSSNLTTFALGQLGTFRYIDSDVVPNKVYYYRVRAYSGDFTGDGTFDQPTQDAQTKIWHLKWPGTDLVMGRPSPVIPAMLPLYPEKFDVLDTLRRLFQVAFSLNFHLALPTDAKGNPTVTFDATTGLPKSGLAAEDVFIGWGSLTSLAGPLTSFQAVPLVGDWVSSLTDINSLQDAFNELPWNDTRVQRNAARLAVIVAGAMLYGGSAVPFKSLMEGPWTKGAPTTSGLGSNLLELVSALTSVQTVEDSSVLKVASDLYNAAYADPVVRLNVLAAVELCKGFTLVGTPPNWMQVSVLRDIVPWSGQLIYDLLAKMQALLDAYKGVTAELNQFIDLLEQKVDNLEKFLKFLTSILNFVESLSLGFYILNVPETGGDVSEWASIIDSAGGTKPPSGPGGYTGGVSFAYVASDVTSFAAALKMIF